MDQIMVKTINNLFVMTFHITQLSLWLLEAIANVLLRTMNELYNRKVTKQQQPNTYLSTRSDK